LELIRKKSRIINSSLGTFIRNTPPIHVYVFKNITAYSVKPHYKDYPQIWYCQEGEYIHQTEHDIYTCKRGSVTVIPPGIAHCIQVPQSANATLLRIDLTFDYLAETSFDAAQNTATVLFLPPLLQNAGISIPEHYTLSNKSQKAATPLMDILISQEQEAVSKRAALEQLVSLPEFPHLENSQEKVVAEAYSKLISILHALTYIHTNYPQKITAEQLCKVSSLCRTTLFHLIRQYLGIPYAAYVTMIRIIRANQALVHTTYSIAYISDRCGFSHSSHMSKCYRKYKGILPKTDRLRQKIYQEKYGKLHITHEFFMDDFFD
jgi:AraC-like DNA-binding protein